MAEATRSSVDLLRRVSEISNCAICLEVVRDAKALPCLHTYCLRCIKELWKDKRAGERVPCPVCRETFVIPMNGLESLRTNFIVQYLAQLDTSSTIPGKATKRECELEENLQLTLRKLLSASDLDTEKEKRCREEQQQAEEHFEASDQREKNRRQQLRTLVALISHAQDNSPRNAQHWNFLKLNQQKRRRISDEYRDATDRTLELLINNIGNCDRTAPTTLDAEYYNYPNYLVSLCKYLGSTSFELSLAKKRQSKMAKLIANSSYKLQESRKAVQTDTEVVKNHLSTTENREEVAKEKWKKSTDRLQTLEKQLEQANKRWKWLETIRSTCRAQTCVHRDFIETACKTNQLRTKLQQTLSREKALSEKLQNRQKDETSLKETLKSLLDKLMKDRDKMNEAWKVYDTELSCHLDKENELQEKLAKAVMQARRCVEFGATSKSKDAQMGRCDLWQSRDQENVFHRPATQSRCCNMQMKNIRDLSLEDGSEVGGITVANDKLCVLCYRREGAEINVYSTRTFAVLLRSEVTGFKKSGIKDMKADKESILTKNVTIYLADSDERCIHTTAINGNKALCIISTRKWSIPGKPNGLSFSNGFLIVACHDDSLLSNTGKLIVLNSMIGTVMRVVIAKPWMSSLSHAIQLKSGEFLISYRGYVWTFGDSIGVIDDAGKVTRSFGNGWMTENYQLLRGAHQMAVDSKGYIYVADNENNRVVLLNQSMQLVRYIATRDRPRWLHVDHTGGATRRLLVGHNSNVVSVTYLFFH